MRVGDVDIHVEGDGERTIVMVHGWPDTYRLWDRQVEALRERYRCVRFTLPGFDRAAPRKAYDLDELTGFLRAVIERVAPGAKVILLLHDWGCAFGYQFYLRHPELVERIVGVDIGDPASTQAVLTGRERFLILAYQTWLAAAWKVGGALGDAMTRWMARRARAPGDPETMSSNMDYPYYVLWFGGARSYRRHGKRFFPACPMLFVYGRRKPMRFHSPRWTEKLAAVPGNRVVEFETGHWVMAQQPERFNQVVAEWLAS